MEIVSRLNRVSFLFPCVCFKQHHQSQCPRVPVQCPNSCGTPGITREDLTIHVKESCGTSMVLCPFKDAGCKYRVRPQVSLSSHNSSHYSLLIISTLSFPASVPSLQCPFTWTRLLTLTCLYSAALFLGRDSSCES